MLDFCLPPLPHSLRVVPALALWSPKGNASVRYSQAEALTPHRVWQFVGLGEVLGVTPVARSQAGRFPSLPKRPAPSATSGGQPGDGVLCSTVDTPKITRAGVVSSPAREKTHTTAVIAALRAFLRACARRELSQTRLSMS